jgi:hypothetical protein
MNITDVGNTFLCCMKVGTVDKQKKGKGKY